MRETAAFARLLRNVQPISELSYNEKQVKVLGALQGAMQERRTVIAVFMPRERE